MTENEIGEKMLGCGLAVHRILGPGLLESAYETCLCYELGKIALPFRRQIELPVRYDGRRIDANYRLDLLVDEKVVVEIKSVETLLPIHEAQLLSYLRLGEFKLGYLLNFNVVLFRDGIRRKVNGL